MLRPIDPRFLEQDGRLDVARELFPEATAPWLDLSTAIAPWTYPFTAGSDKDMRSYPDASVLTRVSAAAHKAYRAPPAADVVALPNVAMGAGILPWLFREPKRVAVVVPDLASHGAAWEEAGHSVSTVGTLDQIGKAAIVVVVNPSPTNGRLLPHSDLAAALPPLKRRNGILVVDERFADADESHSLLPHVARLDYTVVLRSCAEFYGAGGIGLGFAVTSHPIAGRLRAALGRAPVSSAALAFGEAALTDSEWAVMQRERLRRSADEMDGALQSAGLRVLGGTALFRHARCQGPTQLFSHLAAQGILAHPVANDEALRFGLAKDDSELSRLREALVL